MPNHIRLTVHETQIDFYDFIGSSDFEAKARGLQPFLQRMPELHVQRVFSRYLIFVILTKPHGGLNGGTWLPRGVGRAFLGRESATQVPDADLQSLVLDRDKGVIGIPQNRWERPLQQMKITALHEVGHGVDYVLNLSPPGATISNFSGVRPVCRARDLLKRHAVEAYARLIYAPGRICRDVDPADLSTCNARVAGLLRRSPAFASVPESWWHPSHRGRAAETETEAERIRRQTRFLAAGMVRRSGMQYRVPGPTGLYEVPSPRQAAIQHIFGEERSSVPPPW